MDFDSFVYNGGNTSGAWDDPANWSLGRVPQLGDGVDIGGKAAGIFQSDPAYTVASLSIGTGFMGDASELDVYGGRLTVTGTTSLYGLGGELDGFSGASIALENVAFDGGNIVVNGHSSLIVQADTSASSGAFYLAGESTTTIGSINGSETLQFVDNRETNGEVTIGSIPGTAYIQLLAGESATIGTTAGTSTFILDSGRLNLQSAATTLADTIIPGDGYGGSTSGGIIDLQNVAYVPGESYAISPVSLGSNANTYQVQLQNGSVLYTFENVYGTGANDQTAPLIFVASDGASGTLVTIACYIAGTRIATPAGDRAVCDLAIGDEVLTAAGTVRPIKWIGRRTYAGRFLTANPGVQPVRFRTGSLGDGLPRRDLLVSPEHAMFIDRLLIPARCLVNGTTIVAERGLQRVEYIHVELDSHDVILAEGAPSESFYDDDSRGMFHNGAEFGRLYPGEPQTKGIARLASRTATAWKRSGRG